MLEIPDEKARGDGIHKNGLFVERVAEAVWQSDGYGDHIAGFGVHIWATGGVETYAASFDQETFVVHFVEVEDRAGGAGREEGFDGCETHLGCGAVFDYAVEVWRGVSWVGKGGRGGSRTLAYSSPGDVVGAKMVDGQGVCVGFPCGVHLGG